MANNSERPIIIKKIEEEGHGGHHGGAWKVAYADFVTAMMAFFLLLWILNSVQEESLEGIADYFTPTMVPQAGIGGDGLLDGGTIGPDGTLNSSESPFLTIATPRFGQDDPGLDPTVEESSENPNDKKTVVIEYQATEATTDESEIQKILDQINTSKLENVESQIKQAIRSIPELEPLLPNVLFEETPEGLRIQIVDKNEKDMFPSGSTKMYSEMQQLVSLVGQATSSLENEIIITGHTDAVPYTNKNNYGNWELSADRANATRRVLVATGVKNSRIARVSGVAEHDPLVVDDPFDPSNRRISIVLMYGKGEADIDRKIDNTADTTKEKKPSNSKESVNPPTENDTSQEPKNIPNRANTTNEQSISIPKNVNRRNSITLEELQNGN